MLRQCQSLQVASIVQYEEMTKRTIHCLKMLVVKFHRSSNMTVANDDDNDNDDDDIHASQQAPCQGSNGTLVSRLYGKSDKPLFLTIGNYEFSSFCVLRILQKASSQIISFFSHQRVLVVVVVVVVVGASSLWPLQNTTTSQRCVACSFMTNCNRWRDAVNVFSLRFISPKYGGTNNMRRKRDEILVIRQMGWERKSRARGTHQ